jgi:cell wall-associated NlpC family hydrolase
MQWTLGYTSQKGSMNPISPQTIGLTYTYVGDTDPTFYMKIYKNGSFSFRGMDKPYSGTMEPFENYTLGENQPVTFPDPNLEAAIRDEIKKPSGDIYDSDLKELTTLDAWGKNISDLTGLEYCVNLQILYLGQNRINNLQPISGLTKLVSLSLPFNQINDLSPISKLVNLEGLYLYGSPISDLRPISNLLKLEQLSLGNNLISDISPLSNLMKLELLHLQGNKIKDISPLSNLTKLVVLCLDGNEIEDISPLSNLTKLGEPAWYRDWFNKREGKPICLGLWNNKISNIFPLVENLGLSEGDGIDLRGNPLSADSMNTYIPQLQTRLVEILYDTNLLLPSPPAPTSPGSSSSPGPTIDTLTPTFRWNGVVGADYYGLYIRDMSTNVLVFDSQARSIQITGTSYDLPSGVLEWGKPYRWNMNSHNSAGWGTTYSGVLYFQTQVPAPPAGQLLGVDVSIYTGEISPSTWQQMKEAGLEFAIVGAWGGRNQNIYAQQQLSGARQANMKVAAYLLLNFYNEDQSGSWQVEQAFAAIGDQRNYLCFVAIDVELPEGWSKGVNVNQRIQEAIDRVTQAGLIPIIYTSMSEWGKVTANIANFASFPLWDVLWDEIPSLNVNWVSYGNWVTRIGKQYVGETTVFGKKMDLNVFNDTMFFAASPQLITGQYRAEYYNDISLGGSPTFTHIEGSINHDWGNDGPGNGVGNDDFSVRWTGHFDFNAGSYTFIARADDGIRVLVDDNLIIDKWKDQPATEYQVSRTLVEGEHEIKVEYYERGGQAVAQFRWEGTPVIATVKSLGEQAAAFAIQLEGEGAPYLLGGKGWDWKEGLFVDSSVIKEGYHWDYSDHEKIRNGLDCSGLVFWAYNKAVGATSYKSVKNPVFEEGANGQWNDNSRFDRVVTKIPPSLIDLKPGDLLFLDTPDEGIGTIDHVGMYVGNGYVVHSRGVKGVEKLLLSDWLNLPTSGKTYQYWFMGYTRYKEF